MARRTHHQPATSKSVPLNHAYCSPDAPKRYDRTCPAYPLLHSCHFLPVLSSP